MISLYFIPFILICLSCFIWVLPEYHLSHVVLLFKFYVHFELGLSVFYLGCIYNVSTSYLHITLALSTLHQHFVQVQPRFHLYFIRDSAQVLSTF